MHVSTAHTYVAMHRMHRSTDDSITLQYLSLIHGSAVFGLASFFLSTAKGLSTGYCFWYRNLGMLGGLEMFCADAIEKD